MPTTWSGSVCLHTDDIFSYMSCGDIKIYDLESEEQYAYISCSGDSLISVCGNNYYLYIGTLSSGIKYLEKSYLITNSGTLNDFECLVSLVDYPDIDSSYVNYLHTNNNILSCCTDVGVNVIYTISGCLVDHISGCTCGPVNKSFITESGVLYYTVTLSGYDNLNRADSTTTDWLIPDKTYSSEYRGIFSQGSTINDMFVTENTGTDNSNTLFVATSEGVYVIDEGSNSYRVYKSY